MPTPLPVLAGVYYGRELGEFEGLPADNVFCYQNSMPPGSDSAEVAYALAVSFAIAHNWVTHMLPAMASQYTCSGASVYPLNAPSAPAQFTGVPGVGTLPPGGLAPVSTAMLVKNVTLRRGRGSQSRTFLSPVDVNVVTFDGKTLTPAYLPNLQAALDAFHLGVLTDLGTSTPTGAWRYVQLSKASKPGHLPVRPATTFQITSSVAEPVLSTQRRRARR